MLTDMTRARRVLWLDASAGIAGDMLLGALVDAGADRDEVVRLVTAIAPEVRIRWEETSRAGLRALRAVISADGSVPDRSVDGIRTVLAADELSSAEASSAEVSSVQPSSVEPSSGKHSAAEPPSGRFSSAERSEQARSLASAVFDRVIAAESAVHGVPADAVHLHEVGGWDSVADIVGACVALLSLEVDEVVVSPIAVGSGTVPAAHGVLPVPVPGVAELLRDWEVLSGGDGELATPTGAALAVTLADRQGPLPAGRIVAVGVGAGSRDRQERANVVRALVLETATGVTGSQVRMLDEIACTVDDLDPRVWPTVLSRLLEEGALDAWLAPVLMKKGRPGHVLHVLCPPEDTARLGSRVLEQTSSLGYRVTRVARTALERAWVEVSVGAETVSVKLAVRDGFVVRAVTEFDEAAAVAERSGRSVREVLESAVTAAAERGIVAGARVPSDATATRPR